MFKLTFSGESGFIKVRGNKFVDEKNNRIIFKGIALAEPGDLAKDGQWSENHFAKAAEWGANIVRIPVHPRAWREHGPENYLKLLDQGVAWAQKYHMYVIIDWHTIGNLRTEQFQKPNYDTTLKETLFFWRTIAAHYKNNPVVAFYEIYNEPTVYNGTLGRMNWPQLKEIVKEIIYIIYAFDKTVIPLVGGLNWAYDLSPVLRDPVDIPGIAYTTHPYPQKRSQPWEPQWEKDFGAVADKYPVIATEFGFQIDSHEPCIGTVEYGRRIINYFDQKGISWTAWCFHPTWQPVLISDWDYTPTVQGRFFKSVLQTGKIPE